MIAAALTTVVVLTAGAEPYAVLGYSQPDAFTVAGTYLLRAVADAAGAVCLGSLVFATFCTTVPADGLLAPRGWAATRTAAAAGWVWFAATALLVPFDAAESIGVSVLTVLPPPNLAEAVGTLPQPAFWVASALIALVVAVASRLLLRWAATAALAGLAVLGLLAPVAAGNQAGGPDHDLGMVGLAAHVLAAALWLGVLVAVALDARRVGGLAEPVRRRYRRFAAGCWLALAVSGLFTTVVAVPLDAVVGTAYGLLVLVKVVVLGLLGAVAVYGRRWAGATLTRLLAVEVTLLVVTVGVSMGVAQRPPPSWFAGPELGPVGVALGYELSDAPTLLTLLTAWRVDPLFLAGAVLAAAGYLVGVRRLRRAGQGWPPARTASWLAGCVLLVVATSSGVGAYAPTSFSVHMAMHMAISMVAPLLLVLGGPVTLALRATEPAAAGALGGVHDWVRAAVESRSARALAHPAPAAALFAGTYYLLYLTGLFEAAISEHWSRMVMNVVGLAIGYLFWWITVGVDAGPRPLHPLGRFGVLFAVMPVHAVFAVVVMSLPTVIAQTYYRTLDLPWAPDLAADQLAGGIVSLVAGEAALLAAQVVVLVRWHREERTGARPGEDGEAAAYREMLEELRRTRSG